MGAPNAEANGDAADAPGGKYGPCDGHAARRAGERGARGTHPLAPSANPTSTCLGESNGLGAVCKSAKAGGHTTPTSTSTSTPTSTATSTATSTTTPTVTTPAGSAKGRVSVVQIRPDHINAQDIANALPVPRFIECYRTALRSHAVAGSATLHLDLSPSGTGVKLSANDQQLGDVLSCIAGVARSIDVSNVPSSGASADVDLSFYPE